MAPCDVYLFVGPYPAVHVACSAALIAPALPIEDARPLGLSSLPVFTDPLGVYPVCFGEIPLALGTGSNALGLGEMDREPSLAHAQHSLPFIATAGFTDHRTDWIP